MGHVKIICSTFLFSLLTIAAFGQVEISFSKLYPDSIVYEILNDFTLELKKHDMEGKSSMHIISIYEVDVEGNHFVDTTYKCASLYDFSKKFVIFIEAYPYKCFPKNYLGAIEVNGYVFFLDSQNLILREFKKSTSRIRFKFDDCPYYTEEGVEIVYTNSMVFRIYSVINGIIKLEHSYSGY